jgi:hypothetical protein
MSHRTARRGHRFRSRNHQGLPQHFQRRGWPDENQEGLQADACQLFRPRSFSGPISAAGIMGSCFQARWGHSNDHNLRHRWFRPLITPFGIPQPPRSCFDALRHSRVIHLREGGVPDDVVLSWVGHSCIKTTNGYTDRSGDALAAMAEKIGGLSQVVPSPIIEVVRKVKKVA